MLNTLLIPIMSVLLVLSAVLHQWQNRARYDLQSRLNEEWGRNAVLRAEVEDLGRALATRSRRLDELEREARGIREELIARRRPVFDQTLIASDSRYLDNLFAAREQS